MVELDGVEPTTPGLQSRCSPQLSYSPFRLVFLHPAASRPAFVSVTYILIRFRRQKLTLLAGN